MRFLNSLERKFGKFAIKNLMFYIVAANVVVFVVDFMFADFLLSSLLRLIPGRVMAGEVWRLITFIFVPESGNIIFTAISLYFYYIIGMSLENRWGSFQMNVYYLIGMVVSIAASLITGFPVSADSINLSLFLAFASLAPDMQLLIFFVLPVKVKWLGWLAWAWIGYQLINVPGIALKVLILAPTLNYFVFFGPSIIGNISRSRKRQVNRARFESVKPPEKAFLHRCVVCGKTEKDDRNLVFRYCSKCNGDYEYCEDHLRDHNHVE